MSRLPERDIESLYSEVGADHQEYRSFRRKQSASSKLPEVSAPRDAREKSSEVTPPVQGRQAGLSHAVVAGHRSHGNLRDEQNSRWALRSALDDRVNGRLAQECEVAARDLQARTVSAFSLAGGVGTTTVLSTLARVFSKGGDRILMLDGTEDPVIPFYFGVPYKGHWSTKTIPATDASAAAVHLVSRGGGTQDTPVRPAAEVFDDWLWNGLARYNGAVDRVFFDARPGVSERGRQWAEGAAVALAIAVPDLNCVRRIPTFVEAHRREENRLGRPLSLHIVFSKFDPNSSLHHDSHECVMRQYGDLVAPLSIRKSDEVAEALAEGATVVDYAPRSGVAADFMELADWLRNRIA